MHILDRPLLLGLVALERDLISPTELVEAFRTWRLRPESSFGHLLVERGRLSEDCISSLAKLLADSFRADERGGKEPDSREATMTWQHDTASIVAKNEPTKSHDWSRQSTERSAEAGDAGYTALRYRPIRLHAMGGLGQVFVADDLELHRHVALKEIRDSAVDDAVSRRRFVAEAEITGRLEHPGIVPVYGLGVYPDGRPFYAMRFIEGETLAAAIKRFHQKTTSDFAAIELRQLLARIVSVCNAVGFAHSRGIVHRDLKPQNVMLGPFGETLVVDWGLAKPLKGAAAPSDDARYIRPDSSDASGTDDATSMGEVIGTPAYMSPEQAAGRLNEIGPASDVYGLGAILYAFLTGQPPLAGSIADIRTALAHHQIPHPRQVKPHVPRALAAICLKALAAEPADRYASALDLAADIDRWLAGEAASAYAEPWTDTAFRWIRRHRLPVAVTGAVLLAAFIALTVGYVLVRNERDIAQAERKKAVAANELAQDERRRAVAANQRAQENAAATRKVVEQFLIRVGDDRWSQIPGFEELRLEMVNLAVDRYRELIGRHGDDVELRADAALAFQRCANLYRMMGQFLPAQELYDAAVTGLRNVIAAGGNEKYEPHLCNMLCDRADLLLRRDGPLAAEAAMREALVAARTTRQRQPRSLAASEVEARLQGDFSDLLRELERYDEAIRLARSAAVVWQRVADISPRPTTSRATASIFVLNVARILREAERWDEAAAALDDASRRIETWLRDSPTEVNLRFSTAAAGLERALLQIDRTGQTRDAENELTSAIAALKGLAVQFPAVGSFHRKWAEALTAQAEVLMKRSKLEPAASSADQAIKLLLDLDTKYGSPAVYQPLLASAYAIAGQIELQRGDAALARASLEHAREHITRSRAANTKSKRLAAKADDIEALLSGLR